MPRPKRTRQTPKGKYKIKIKIQKKKTEKKTEKLKTELTGKTKHQKT